MGDVKVVWDSFQDKLNRWFDDDDETDEAMQESNLASIKGGWYNFAQRHQFTYIEPNDKPERAYVRGIYRTCPFELNNRWPEDNQVLVEMYLTFERGVVTEPIEPVNLSRVNEVCEELIDMTRRLPGTITFHPQQPTLIYQQKGLEGKEKILFAILEPLYVLPTHYQILSAYGQESLIALALLAWDKARFVAPLAAQLVKLVAEKSVMR